jgi:hypothetical protein
MTSMAPLRVAGLIEFHVLDTDPEMDRTYCIPLYVRKCYDEAVQNGIDEGMR